MERVVEPLRHTLEVQVVEQGKDLPVKEVALN